ncbi:related to LPD1-dihydrolipoamide dehydrogenase precursor [Phialocephala subalpina]|uniref:Related to LPD1-dihydrolipoamide dehydrogenase n=1 Tax=Phialocephala subalpina TaxID=576137 RepID=A0A1L7WY96_9HELO|nr:related to LPD1-dihydrolipoamide dehydrogenase precursor [Phialocephala subalpina]
MSTHYQALIIGSGQAGTPLASSFAKAGYKTALVERSHIAGCCVNEGCTPTKTLIASGRVAYLARRGRDYGIHTGGEEGKEEGKSKGNKILVDMKKVRQRKREIVNSFRGGSEKRLEGAGVEVLIGEASFVDEKTVKVKMNDGSEKMVTSDRVLINTGERPAPPRLTGIETLDPKIVLDSTSIQELDEVPEHLVVVGGGYVGVEFAQLMRRLGAKVTVLQRGKQLLPREDPEIAQCLLDILKEDGLEVLLQTQASRIEPVNAGFTLTYTSLPSNEPKQLTGSHILFASGRIPNTESLNLPAACIKTNANGYITSNEFLETPAPNVYVMGDAKGPPAFTHISYDDFRILEKNLITHPTSDLSSKASTKNRLVPYVVYTDPQLGHIGLRESEARGLPLYKNHPERIKIAKMPMSYVARALETDESRGMMKAVVDAETGLILGFTCLGLEGGEVIAVVQMAMLGGVRWEVLQSAVWAHPSLAESLNNIWGFLE